MTPAERQQQYRRRHRRAVTDAIGNERCASRAELVNLLAHQLGVLDRDFDRSAARHGAGRVIKELITRYQIDLVE